MSLVTITNQLQHYDGHPSKVYILPFQILESHRKKSTFLFNKIIIVGLNFLMEYLWLYRGQFSASILGELIQLDHFKMQSGRYKTLVQLCSHSLGNTVLLNEAMKMAFVQLVQNLNHQHLGVQLQSQNRQEKKKNLTRSVCSCSDKCGLARSWLEVCRLQLPSNIGLIEV